MNNNKKQKQGRKATFLRVPKQETFFDGKKITDTRKWAKAVVNQSVNDAGGLEAWVARIPKDILDELRDWKGPR